MNSFNRKTKEILENLPPGYKFEDGKLYFKCAYPGCDCWTEILIRQSNIYEGRVCKNHRYVRVSEKRRIYAINKAVEYFKENNIDYIKYNNEKDIFLYKCSDCGEWFEINYLHNCNHYIEGKHYCSKCIGKIRSKAGKISGEINHQKSLNLIKDFVDSHERYRLNENNLVEYRCDECNEWYIMDQDNLGVYFKQEKHYCKNCRDKIRIQNSLKTVKKPGVCSNCKKFVNARYPGGRCYECHIKFSIKILNDNQNRKICTSCLREIEGKKDAAGRCKTCQSNAAIRIREGKFCNTCGIVTPHNGYFCLICHPESSPNGVKPKSIFIEDVFCYNGEFITEIIRKLDCGDYKIKDLIDKGWYKIEDNWFYNNECLSNPNNEELFVKSFFFKINDTRCYQFENEYIPVIDFINMIENGEIDAPENWIKKDKEWYYKGNNILKDSISSLNGSILTKVNNIEFFYDNRINKYIPWEIFKQNKIIDDINSDILTDIQKNYNAFYIQTFISKERSINCGHAAFDKLLLENEIDYFVYIKMYKDENNNILPLVCGESGSFNVNSSGCDLSFSKDINHGPSRKFLFENNFDYFYDQVLLIKTNSKNESKNH